MSKFKFTLPHGFPCGNHEFRVPAEFLMRSYTPVGFEKLIINESLRKNYGCVVSPSNLKYAMPTIQTFKWVDNKDFTK